MATSVQRRQTLNIRIKPEERGRLIARRRRVAEPHRFHPRRRTTRR
jgi:hypothetical protein